MFITLLKYFLIILGIIALYEAIRAFIVSYFKSKLYSSINEQLEKYKTRLDNYKFMHKVIVKNSLLNDPEIYQGILEHAREKGLSIHATQKQVEDYIEEIVPFFNLLSYYKVGYKVANFFLNLIYEVVIDRENAEKLRKIPPDSVVVFVMNHRSNIDYILVAYMLAKQISVSYAVGEWARIWPLEFIFKSFGAYFIRRKFREKLYHLVLEKYVQLISLQGVTQGIFLEGGLTRNGKLRKSKVGILDYIIKIKKNPEFKRELVFVPASINYDWVLEDKNLIKEWKNKKEKTGFGDHMGSLFKIMLKTPLLLALNLLRYFSGRLKEHGYASVSFGDPVYLSDFIKKGNRNIFKLERHKRLEKVQKFGDQLLKHSGKAIPATPVCITAAALLSFNSDKISKDDLTTKVGEIRDFLKSKDGRIVLGKAFESNKESISKLEKERPYRRTELFSFEERLLEHDESQQTVDIALDLMKRRRFLSTNGDKIIINNKKKAYLEFYANALECMLEDNTL